MAKLKNPPNFITSLKTVLLDTLRSSGIDATVESEPVPTTKLYRLAIYAPQFKEMTHSERQNFIWRIVENTLPPDEQMRISMILTLTPNETHGR